MGKNRTIPFGYTMRNGVIETEPTEVLAVLTIFSEYMAGCSLNEIAREMAVPYSEGGAIFIFFGTAFRQNYRSVK